MFQNIQNNIIIRNTQKIVSDNSSTELETHETIKANNTNDDKLVEIKTSDETQDTKSRIRNEYADEQNEYFKYQTELDTLKKDYEEIKKQIKEYNENKKKVTELQKVLSDINFEIKIAKENIKTSLTTLKNLNIQILNSAHIDTTASLNSAKNNTKHHYDNEPIPQKLASKLDKTLGEGFSNKCKKVAAQLNCNANDLIAMMYSESSLNPSKRSENGAVGLIQFMPSTLQEYGYSASKVGAMSAKKQLDVIADILMKSKLLGGYSKNDELDAGSLYAICFLPAVSSDNVLCSKNGKLKWAYKSNAALDLNSDGKITKEDLENRLNNKYNEMMDSFDIKCQEVIHTFDDENKK